MPTAIIRCRNLFCFNEVFISSFYSSDFKHSAECDKCNAKRWRKHDEIENNLRHKARIRKLILAEETVRKNLELDRIEREFFDYR